MRKKTTLKITLSAFFLAVAIILPFFTAQIKDIGRLLCPMHLPVLLCGFICGPFCGLCVGFVAPILRSLCFGMPLMFPDALVMALELATYGFSSGLFYKMLPKKLPFIYLSLILSMLCGRLVWGLARMIVSGISKTEFPFSTFISVGFIEALPGIAVQILLIPIIVCEIKKLRLFENK